MTIRGKSGRGVAFAASVQSTDSSRAVPLTCREDSTRPEYYPAKVGTLNTRFEGLLVQTIRSRSALATASDLEWT